MSKTPAPLVIKKFTKAYGSFLAVDNVSVSVKAGEVFGFLGPNGAGKSTTIRSILNFISPTKGSITIKGLDSVSDSIEAKNHIGYLAGDIALYSSMTGWQLFHHLTALGKQTDWAYVDQLVERLDANPDAKIKSLSKGNRQKIGLIQAFMHKPDVLMLDEPTSGLDPLMKEVFYEMTREMRESGKTIFLSSHDLSEVQKICDRAAFIRGGVIVATKNIKDLLALKYRRYAITFKEALTEKQVKAMKGVSGIKMHGKTATVELTGSTDEFIKTLAKYTVLSLDELESSLEDVFMHYYEERG